MKTCGDCIWIHQEEAGGSPYCLVQDLYYNVSPSEKACEDFVERNDDSLVMINLS